MNSSVYLFIGGSWDGKRERVPDERLIVKVATARPLNTSPYKAPSFDDSKWADETYDKRIFCEGEKIICIFVSSSVPTDGVFEMLISGYLKK